MATRCLRGGAPFASSLAAEGYAFANASEDVKLAAIETIRL